MTDLRTDIPMDEVRAAVAEHVRQAGQTDVFTARHKAGAVLGFDNSGFGRDYNRAYEKFRGQVRTALNELAAAGTVRKAGGGEVAPDGNKLARNEARYYTPEEWHRIEQREAERREARVAETGRRKAVERRLSALVLPPIVTSGGRIALQTEHWEILLDLAEKGAGRG